MLWWWVLACDGPTTDGPATLDHRPVAETCGERPLPAEPVGCPATGTYLECQVHADCVAGDAGTCQRGGSYGYTCVCGYDVCHADADCGDGVCGCASDPAVQSLTNRCLAGGCRIDADCPSGRCQADHGFFCGTASPEDVLPVTGWYCSTADDTCNGDEDCDVAGGDRCTWSGARFACSRDYQVTCD